MSKLRNRNVSKGYPRKKKVRPLVRLSFGEALAHLMKMKKVSSLELAVRVGVFPQTIEYWTMDAIPRPDRKIAIEVAEALGVPPKMLLVALEE